MTFNCNRLICAVLMTATYFLHFCNVPTFCFSLHIPNCLDDFSDICLHLECVISEGTWQLCMCSIVVMFLISTYIYIVTCHSLSPLCLRTAL